MVLVNFFPPRSKDTPSTQLNVVHHVFLDNTGDELLKAALHVALVALA